ncbi:hypothetical protein [Sphingomonas bacterium]|nr:hypothetical protein [Sphingomonas bacterium]
MPAIASESSSRNAVNAAIEVVASFVARLDRQTAASSIQSGSS